MFTKVEDALNWLQNIKKKAPKTSLDRMKKCANILGNPQNSFKSIHVAGTNGKGSTCAYLKSILSLKYKVGFYTSPYVICFNERIEINDSYISDLDIVKYSNILYDLSKRILEEDNDIVTFFELTTLMCFMYFKDQKIDIAVIECGMGGLLDATNIINSEMQIITNVGYDHMQSLGNTLEEIAMHKLGIIRKDKLLITCYNNQLHQLFIDKSNDICELKEIKLEEDIANIKISQYTEFKVFNTKFKVSLLGIHQAYNATLAIYAILRLNEFIKDMDLFFTIKEIKRGLLNAKWPGRLEKIKDNPLVYIDGAHNIDGINALINSLDVIKKKKKVKIIFTALKDKAYLEMIDILKKKSDELIITTIDDQRAINLDEFANDKSIRVVGDYKEAVSNAINNSNKNELIVITGSLHFISIARKYLIN